MKNMTGPRPPEKSPRYSEERHQVLFDHFMKKITSRRQAEEALMYSEKRYQALFDQSPDGILLINDEGKIIEFNETAHRQLGYSREEFAKLSLSDIDPVESPEEIQARIKRVLTDEKAEFEAIHRTKQGDLRNVYVITQIFHLSGRNVFQAIWRDITKHKQMEESLRRKEKELRDITSSVAEGIYVMNNQGNIIFMNPEAERLLGWTIPELRDRNAHDLIHYMKPDGSPLPFEECGMHKVIDNGIRFISSDEVFVRKDGTVFPVSIICSPVIGDGHTIASVTAFRDISEQKAMELERERLIFDLGVANEELEHEIAERKRVEDMLKAKLMLSQYADNHSLDEVLQATIDNAEMITRSRIGFFHFVEPDQATLTLQSWSTATRRQCTASGKGRHYPVSSAGVWVDCIRERRAVIHNDYAGLQHKQGLPGGHVPLMRELCVPIFQGREIVAVIGVGNKLTDYLAEDVGYVTQLAYIAWDIVQRKQAEEKLRLAHDELELRVLERTSELKLSNEQLRNLAAHLQSVREEERMKIAREIHDELGQMLSAQKMELSWFRQKYGDHKPIFDKTGIMLDTLSMTIQSVRRICTELRPSILDNFGLVDAMKWQADEFQTRTGIECRLDCGPADPELDKDLSTVLFRIFQEALTNVLKHADATKVTARLIKNSDNIILEVIDNGRGITDEQLSKPQSFGIIGMRERVYPWGGKVEISGYENRGTSVKVCMPLV